MHDYCDMLLWWNMKNKTLYLVAIYTEIHRWKSHWWLKAWTIQFFFSVKVQSLQVFRMVTVVLLWFHLVAIVTLRGSITLPWFPWMLSGYNGFANEDGWAWRFVIVELTVSYLWKNSNWPLMCFWLGWPVLAHTILVGRAWETRALICTANNYPGQNATCSISIVSFRRW